MSQIQDSVSSTPEVPTTFVTDDGNATPAANTLNILGNDTTDPNDNGIQTTGSGDTVTVELTNRLQGSATSTNGSNADLITFDLGASAIGYRFQFQVVGRDTTTDDVVGYSVFGTAKSDGATATVVKTEYTDDDEDDSLTDSAIDFLASGNNIILRATGPAACTVSFKAAGLYLEV